MKKLIIASIILLMFITVGCEYMTDKDFTEVIVDYESVAFDFHLLHITYDRYLERTKDIAVNPENLISTKIILNDANNDYVPLELKSLDEEQLKELRESNPSIQGINPSLDYKVSKPYYFNDNKSAYVFTIRNNTSTFSGKRYTFKKINDSWKIESIEIKDSKTKFEKDAIMNTDINFHTYNDKKIDYVTNYSVIND